MRRCVCGIIVLTFLKFTFADEPPRVTDQQIAQAIRDLGDPDYTVREKASKFLWQAGQLAENALGQAAQSSDPEVSRRAVKILDQFANGIYPNTSQPTLSLIARYRASKMYEKPTVALSLLERGVEGRSTLRKLLKRETIDHERKYLFAQFSGAWLEGYQRNSGLLAPLLARLIVANQFDEVEDILRMSLEGGREEAFDNFATYHALRGTLPKVITQFSKDRDNTQAGSEERQNVELILTYLHRANGDLPATLAAAKATDRAALIEAALWEASNWSGLQAAAGVGNRDFGGELCIQLAYARLTRDENRSNRLVRELKTFAETNRENFFQVRRCADALLLNNRSVEALDLLKSLGSNSGFRVELLATRLEFPEALKLSQEPLNQPFQSEYESNERAVNRAKLFGTIGERETAKQLFTNIAENLRNQSNTWYYRELLRAEIRVGLRELAAEHLVRFLQLMRNNEVQNRDQLDIIGEVFGKDRATVAKAWHDFLRRQYNRESLPDLAAKLRDVMSRTPEASALKLADEFAQKLADFRVPHGWLAVADTYAAAGQDQKAIAAYEKAAKDGADRDALARPQFVELLDDDESTPQSKLAAEAHMRLADFHVEAKRLRQAAHAYRLAWTADPSQAAPLFLHGWALKESGADPTEGERLMKLARLIPLGREYDRANFAEELAKRGHLADALTEREFLLKHGWYRCWEIGNVLNHVSRDLVRRKQYSQAADYLEKGVVGLVRSGARFIEASAYLTVPVGVQALRARALIESGKLDEGLKLGQECLQVSPGNLELTIALVAALRKAQRKAEADQLFEKAIGRYRDLLKIYQNSSYLHNAAAWLSAGCRHDLDAALTHAQMAIRFSPEVVGYLDTLAEVHFRRGERDKAVSTIRECVKREPRNEYFRKQLHRFQTDPFDSDTPEED